MNVVLIYKVRLLYVRIALDCFGLDWFGLIGFLLFGWMDGWISTSRIESNRI